MCQRSPSKVSGLFIKISALFTANFRFVAVLYIPYLVPSIFFDARLVRSNRLVKSNKMQQNVAKTGWELTKVARIGRSRSVYGQKRVEGGVGQSREPKLSVCCLRTSAHPFLAKNRPGAPVFGYCPLKFLYHTTTLFPIFNMFDTNCCINRVPHYFLCQPCSI